MAISSFLFRLDFVAVDLTALIERKWDAQRKMLSGAGTLVIGRSEAYAGVGHNGVYEFDGQWYYIAHGYDTKLNGASKLVLKPIRWEKGWPLIEN